jgi:hypothetical protein
VNVLGALCAELGQAKFSLPAEVQLGFPKSGSMQSHCLLWHTPNNYIPAHGQGPCVPPWTDSGAEPLSSRIQHGGEEARWRCSDDVRITATEECQLWHHRGAGLPLCAS